MRKKILSTWLAASTIALAAQASAEPAFILKSAGRKPAPSLKVKTSHVPTYSLVTPKGEKIHSIPRLDLGEEPRISANDLSAPRFPASAEVNLKPIRKLESPEVFMNDKILKDLPSFTKSQIVTPPDAIDHIPDIKDLGAPADFQTQAVEPQVKIMEEMNPNDYKLLQALIFLEMHKNYELAMGLFSELIEDPKHHLEALYQYALTAKGLGLNSEFREYMLKVARESQKSDWKMRATQKLVDNIDVLETSDIQYIDPLVQETDVDVSTKDLYQLTRAKYYLNEAKLGAVEEALVMIPEKSPYYNEALIVSGLYNYRQGKLDEAIMDLEKVLPLAQKKWPLRSVAAITLARMHFQKGQFKEAFQDYLQVDKSDALWLQAMVEQAWTQILGEDYEGAAGNMFSLHTDFFKNAFAPESYVVRTVGYLNLCQFGDGLQVLGEMKQKYTPWKTKMEAYSSTHKQSSNYYDTVKSWIKNSDLKEVDGLPRSFIVELARHPAFLKVQAQINTYEDEITKFNQITISLIRKQKEIVQKENEVIKSSSNADDRNRRLMPLRIQEHIAKKAANSIKALRIKGVARINKEKEDLRIKASVALENRYKELYSSLDRVLGQTDVLSYELYSGAGEHIRYQMSGGDVNDKQRDELKVQDDKSLRWKTKGEVWEDEVGHYRSSLKNVCPKEAVANINENSN